MAIHDFHPLIVQQPTLLVSSIARCCNNGNEMILPTLLIAI
jgi:hypothetical protein